jgi:hypothetical protein
LTTLLGQSLILYPTSQFDCCPWAVNSYGRASEGSPSFNLLGHRLAHGLSSRASNISGRKGYTVAGHVAVRPCDLRRTGPAHLTLHPSSSRVDDASPSPNGRRGRERGGPAHLTLHPFFQGLFLIQGACFSYLQNLLCLSVQLKTL